MLALAQISISNDNYFFKLYSFSSPVHFWFLFGHRESCVPLFVQLKQPSIFSPLSCSCSALKICTDAVESRRHAEDNIASPLLFSPKEFFLSLQTIFFSISSICFPLLYLYKKAQTTTFLIKFLRCFFSLSPIFLTFLGFGDKFYFLTFFSSGFGKRLTVESGEDAIGLFLPCDMKMESC